MRAFEEFGAQDTRFHHLRDSDPTDTAVENSRIEPKVVFIRKCRAHNETEIEAVEANIRSLLGHSCAPDSVQFKSRIDMEKQKHLKEVGMTEWILMSTGLVECIKKQFQRRWIEYSMFETENRLYGLPELPPTGEQFLKQQCQVLWDYDREQQNTHQVVHEVQVKFKPTGFCHCTTISPPYVE